MTHTPGPWRATTEGFDVVGPFGTVAVIRPSVHASPNQRLIAAVPDLLVALRIAENSMGENLAWIADLADLGIRQGDPETLRRLAHLRAGWQAVVLAIARAEGGAR